MTVKIHRAVVVKFEFEGIHHWPGCPFEDVSYLKSPHRHMFRVTATRPVTHNDREVEIIRLKHAMIDWVNVNYKSGQLGTKSCEDIAEQLTARFDLISCEVLEDGENGALVWRAN